jgi:hypothetical protein
MRRIPGAIVLSLAGVLVLTGCTGPDRAAPGTVTGALVRVGGPAPGAAVPLPGEIVAVGPDGARFAVTAGKTGRYSLSLPPGVYRLTGHSPLVHAGSAEMQCAAQEPVRVIAGKSAPSVNVVCSVR